MELIVLIWGLNPLSGSGCVDLLLALMAEVSEWSVEQAVWALPELLRRASYHLIAA